MLSIRRLPGVEPALRRWPKLGWRLRQARKLTLRWRIRRARLKARAIGCILPPGRLDPSENSPATDQLFFLKKAKILGPIFKLIRHGGYMTCLVGHASAVEFLRAHEEALDGNAVDLRGLFPKGHIRAMKGEDHRRYRRLFVQALQATPLAFHEDAIRQWIFDKLSTLANDTATAVSGSQLRLCLREIATGIMLRVLFGLTQSDSQFPVIVQNYRRFGPDAPTGWISPDQAEAFFEIQSQVQHLADAIRRNPHDQLPSFLKFMVEQDELDETALGNLIYALEGSHFDLYSLWRWIVKHVVSNPDWIRKVRNTPSPARTPLCEASVMETLRLESSEYLSRSTNSDISFRHYFIPKSTHVRVCVWEAHKNPRVFPDPFTFNPERFLSHTYPLEEYAPFGLDNRHCIASNFVVTLSAIFIDILLERFVITLASDGAPKFGAWHWEPNPDFSIGVSRV